MKDLGRLITAMVTPFTNNGDVDFERAKEFALALVNTGSDGLLIGGTTGESPSMNEDEKLELFKSVKAPLNPGVQNLAAVLAHPEGLISIRKLVRVVSNQSDIKP